MIKSNIWAEGALALLLLGTLTASAAAEFPSNPIPAYSPEAQAVREAAALRQEAERLQEEGRSQEARTRWLAAIEAYRRAGYPPGEIELLLQVGVSYQSELLANPEAMNQAANYALQGMVAAGTYLSELANRTEPVDRRPFREPDELFRRASDLAAAGKCAEASPLFVEAGRKYSMAQSPAGEMRSWTGRLRCQSAIDDPLAAMGVLSSLLDFQRIAGALQGRADAGPWIRYLRAVEDVEMGRLFMAELMMAGALGEFEQSGDARHAALAALDLGGLLARRGEAGKASAFYRRAEQLTFGLRDADAARNRAAAIRNLASLSTLAVPMPAPLIAKSPGSRAPTSVAAAAEPATENVPERSRGQIRREAMFLMGDGDRLYRSGHVKEAREKWLLASQGFEDAKDPTNLADAYRRLGRSSMPEGLSPTGPSSETVSYMIRELAAAAETMELFARKRWRGDRSMLTRADELLARAEKTARSGGCAEARPLLEDAARLYRSAGFPFGAFRSRLTGFGCIADSGNPFGALRTLFEAFSLFQALPDSDFQDEIEAAADKMASERKLAAAKNLYEELLCRSEKARDVEGIASHLVGLARIQLELGDLAQSEINLQRALGFLPDADDEDSESLIEIHERLGAIRFAQGRVEEGVEELRSARDLIQRTGDPKREVLSLYRLAIGLSDGGDTARALAVLEEADSLQGRLPLDPEREGDILTIRGAIQFQQGKMQEALSSCYRAEKLFAEVGDSSKGAMVSGLLSGLQDMLGKDPEHFPEAPAAGLKNPGVLTLLTRAGDFQRLGLLFRAGKYKEAAAMAQESLSSWAASGNRDGESWMRAMLAACDVELGKKEEAERELETVQALQIPGSGDGMAGPLQSVIESLVSLIKIKLKVGDLLDTARQEAGAGNELSPERSRQLMDELGRVAREEAQSLESAKGILDFGQLNAGGFGALERLIAGDPAGALKEFDQSISMMQQWGKGLTVSELRASFFDRYSSLLTMGAQIGLSAQRPDEAFRYAEEARARAFLDQIGNQKIDVSRKGDPELLRREWQIRFQLTRLEKELREERKKPFSDQSPERLENLQRSLEQVGRDWEDLRIRLKATNPEYASLVNVEPLRREEVQKEVLDGETSVVEYFVPDSPGDQVFAWVIDRDHFEMLPLRILSGDLKKRVTEFRNLIAAHLDVGSQASELYRDLFAPLEPQVRQRNLIIVPHSVLHFLPFAALWDEKRRSYLGDSYALSYAPSATALKFARQRKARAVGPVLVVGDPDGSLPHAALEAQAVSHLYGGEPLIGRAAAKDVVVDRAGQAGILHLAAHAVLNPVNPLFTRIELAPGGGSDGGLEMHEVFGLDLSRTGLVVLSACQTQLGTLSAGDELEGLTRAFLYAGTPAVLASLWNVEDESTAFLMTRFYTHLRQGAGRAESLRRAQMETRKRFPHPYQWAAFVLTGDGR